MAVGTSINNCPASYETTQKPNDSIVQHANLVSNSKTYLNHILIAVFFIERK